MTNEPIVDPYGPADRGLSFDPLDPDATVTDVDGVSLQADLPDPPSAANGWRWDGYSGKVLSAFEARRRMLEGDETGVDIVERLRFHAERGYRTPAGMSAALMLEAAFLVESLRESLSMIKVDETVTDGPEGD